MMKYVIYPGPVVSKHDGSMKRIRFFELVRLYGLDPRDCINADHLGSHAPKTFMVLGPRFDGDYKEHLETVTKLEGFSIA